MKFNFTTRTTETNSKGKTKKTLRTSFLDTKELNEDDSKSLAQVVAKTMNIQVEPEELERFVEYLLKNKDKDEDNDNGNDENEENLPNFRALFLGIFDSRDIQKTTVPVPYAFKNNQTMMLKVKTPLELKGKYKLDFETVDKDLNNQGSHVVVINTNDAARSTVEPNVYYIPFPFQEADNLSSQSLVKILFARNETEMYDSQAMYNNTRFDKEASAKNIFISAMSGETFETLSDLVKKLKIVTEGAIPEYIEWKARITNKELDLKIFPEKGDPLKTDYKIEQDLEEDLNDPTQIKIDLFINNEKAKSLDVTVNKLEKNVFYA